MNCQDWSYCSCSWKVIIMGCEQVESRVLYNHSSLVLALITSSFSNADIARL